MQCQPFLIIIIISGVCTMIVCVLSALKLLPLLGGERKSVMVYYYYYFNVYEVLDKNLEANLPNFNLISFVDAD